MSKSVDERVVSMRFDNSQFESGVKTSLSTLDKLKAALHLDGATKGLENVNAAAKRVDMNGLGAGIETVRAKFSAMEVVAVTALANIANSAVNTGKRIVSALTIQPPKDGLAEYENQINSVQTIMANTGEDVKTVNAALDELNEYADLTIYNFATMTHNAGMFTAAMGEGSLDKTMIALKGIGNWAAYAGANTQQMGDATYQLGQALSSGTIRLQDWMSVEKAAGMGGAKYREEFMETARQHGINVDAIVEKNGSFRESLRENWLTTDIFIETMERFANDPAMTDAATKVKTFTQLIDTTKEALGTGWASSWRIIIGDFEEAKTLWTSVSDVLMESINKASDARNKILGEAFGSKWGQLAEQIENAGVSVSDFETKIAEVAKSHGINVDKLVEKYGSLDKVFQSGHIGKSVVVETFKKLADAEMVVGDTTGEVTDKLECFQKVVDEIWAGSWGNGVECMQKLADAGYDYAKIQDLVNKTVDGHKLTIEELSDVELENIGMTEEQVAALRELQKQADETGTPLNELINNLKKLNKPSGRDLLVESIQNFLKAFIDLKNVASDAWNEAFPIDKATLIYNILEAINKFSKAIQLTDSESGELNETAKNLKDTLKGLFTIFEMISTVTGGGLKFALKVAAELFGFADINVLELTGSLGRSIVEFRKQHDVVKLVADTMKNFGTTLKSIGTNGSKSLQAIWSVLKLLGSEAKKFFDAFLAVPEVQDALGELEDVFADIEDYFSGGIKAIQGFAERLKKIDFENLDMKTLESIIEDFTTNVIGHFTDFNISFTGMYNTFVDVKNKLIEEFEKLSGKFSGISGKAKEAFDFLKDLLPSAVALYMGFQLIKIIGKLATALDNLTTPLKSLMDISNGVNKVLGSFSKVLNGIAFLQKAKAMKELAIAIGILAGSIAVLCIVFKQYPDEVGKATGTIAGLIVLMGLLAVAAGTIKVEKMEDFTKLALFFLSLSGSLLILAGAIKMLDDVGAKDAIVNAGILMGMAAILATIAGILSKKADKFTEGGLVLLAFAASVKIMASALIDLDKANLQNVGKSLLSLAVIVGLMGALALACKGLKMDFKSMLGILSMALSLKVLVSVISSIGDMDFAKIRDNLDSFVVIFGMFGALILSSKFAGKYAAKAGLGMLGIAASLLIVCKTIEKIGDIDSSVLDQATRVISQLLLVFGAVILASKLAGQYSMRAGVMLLGMSASLLIIAGIIHLLKKIPAGDLKRVVNEISQLLLVFGAVIALTHFASESAKVMGTLITITAAITLLSIAIIALTLCDASKVKTATVALTSVMGMLSVLMFVSKYLNAGEKEWKRNAATIGALTIAIMAITACIAVLAKMTNPKSAIGAATSLSILLGTLAGAMWIVSNSLPMGPDKVKNIGLVLLELSGVLVIAGIIVGVMSNFTDTNAAIKASIALSTILLAVSGAAVILSYVSPVAAAASSGATAMLKIIGIVSAIILGVGYIATLLDEKFGGGTFIDKMADNLGKLGTAIGSFVGNLLGSVVGGIVDSTLAGVGSGLSKFGKNVEPFLEMLENIDDSAIEKGKKLAELILCITGSSLIDGILDFCGMNSMERFSENIVAYADAMKAFCEKLSEIDISNGQQFDTIVEMGYILTALDNQLPEKSHWYNSEMNLDRFGKNVKKYGECMKDFCDSLGETDITNGKEFDIIVAMGYILTALDNQLPEQSHWYNSEMNLDGFGKNIEKYGECMKDFCDSLGETDITNGKEFSIVVAMGQILAELDNQLPEQSHWWDSKMNLDDFGKNIEKYGESIGAFCEILSGTDMDLVKILLATSISDQLSILAKSITDEGDILPDFGSNVKKFGEKLNDYYDEIEGVDWSVVASSISQCDRLKNFVNSLGDVNTTGVENFKIAIDELGTVSINDFATKFDAGKPKAMSSVSGLMTGLTTTVNSGKPALTSSIGSIMSGMLSVIGIIMPSFALSGRNLSNSLGTGVSNGQTIVTSNMTNVVKSALSAAKQEQTSFVSVGAFLAQGLAQGISGNQSSVINAAVGLAKVAVGAVKNTLDINSPSKVFKKIGSSVPEGFALGITTMSNSITNASERMADTAIDGANTAMTALQSVFSSDLEKVQPTISPVMDLSRINTSIKDFRIDTSIDASIARPVDSLANVIDKAQRDIMASNNEVISAIKGLREDMTTYYTADDKEISFNVDGKKLASAIAKPMSRQLNILSRRGAF